MTTPFGAFTNLPHKKTRRGKRKGLGEPGKHIANALKAHKAGDHASAKSHAFKFIRSLPMPENEPDASDPMEMQEDEMPSVSKAQNAAMHAAASGHSTLGIPAKVGKEFVAADAGTKVSALPWKVKAAQAAKSFAKK